MNTRRYHHFVISLYWYALLLLVLLTLAFPKIDLVLWINQSHNDFQDLFFKVVTLAGEGWLFIPLLIYTLFIRVSLSLAVTAIAAGHGLICSVIKRVFFAHELRPTALINNDLLYLIPDVSFHSHYSFPSGHTATIFCFAVYVSLLIKNRVLSVFLLVLALGVGYSRIYLLQHFLIDVTAGAFIGTLTAFAFAYYFDRSNFPSWANTHIQWR
ncbi:MAG: phosphatase PAP2 family protein [Bacteroidetes bacterium]|nr:phosphatase PAP2 family protein [Bacteroidota bacterium]